MFDVKVPKGKTLESEFNHFEKAYLAKLPAPPPIKIAIRAGII